jgi:hypothetical protein
MSQRFLWTLGLGLCVLAGCGGGSSSPSSTSSGSSSSSSSGGASGANVVTLTVGPGPTADNGGTFNVSYASVKLCRPSTSTCATIDNVLVDTGSTGLRIMASALSAAGLTLSNTPDPSNAGNVIAECQPFVDGYTWGPVVTADASFGGELASGVSVNIIDDDESFAASVPSGCTVLSDQSLNSVVALSANGVLGVGAFDQDCGTSCSECGSACNAQNDIYYSCNVSADACSTTPVALTAQVRNPVALFAVDNNGVILQLPAIPAAGQVGASGSLIFGIATQSNNGLGSATVLTLDENAFFTTMFDGQTLTSSFIDSGSNGLFFPDSSIPVCMNTTADPTASEFFCPTSTQMLSATNQGQNGLTSTVQFEVSSVTSINDTFYANDSIGGPAAPNATLGPYFDWGLPFFYGRSVYTAIEGKQAGSAIGPYVAY